MAEIECDAHITSPGLLGNPYNVSEPGQVKAIVGIEGDAKIRLRGEIGDSVDGLDRPLFCSASASGVAALNGDPHNSCAPLQGFNRRFQPSLIIYLGMADVHS